MGSLRDQRKKLGGGKKEDTPSSAPRLGPKPDPEPVRAPEPAPAPSAPVAHAGDSEVKSPATARSVPPTDALQPPEAVSPPKAAKPPPMPDVSKRSGPPALPAALPVAPAAQVSPVPAEEEEPAEPTPLPQPAPAEEDEHRVSTGDLMKDDDNPPAPAPIGPQSALDLLAGVRDDPKDGEPAAPAQDDAKKEAEALIAPPAPAARKENRDQGVFLFKSENQTERIYPGVKLAFEGHATVTALKFVLIGRETRKFELEHKEPKTFEMEHPDGKLRITVTFSGIKDGAKEVNWELVGGKSKGEKQAETMKRAGERTTSALSNIKMHLPEILVVAHAAVIAPVGLSLQWVHQSVGNWKWPIFIGVAVTEVALAIWSGVKRRKVLAENDS